MKVLVAGSWSDADADADAEYTVLFDSVAVEATLIQKGVLRCYAPGLFSILCQDFCCQLALLKLWHYGAIQMYYFIIISISYLE